MDLVTVTVGWLTDPAHWSGPSGIPARLGEHIALSAASLLVALVIALPVGLWVGHTKRGARLAVNTANLARAVPSLAVIGITAPITSLIDPQVGFRIIPTIIAMVALGVPPILVNAYVGVSEVDQELTESARGMGLTEWQLLRGVELPLAFPVIAGGIGSAAVQIIATATLGAIFGFGGLGRYLVEGKAQGNDGMIFAGVVLVAALALSAEAGFTLLARRATPRGVRAPETSEQGARPVPATGV